MAKEIRMLIADDEFELLSKSEKYFVKKGFAVETVEDGEACIRKAMDFLPDVILLDMQMPKKTAYEVIEYLESKDFELPHVIVLSGSIDNIDKAIFESKKIKFMDKPADLDKIYGWIMEMQG